jgi:hypothetical protein
MGPVESPHQVSENREDQPAAPMRSIRRATARRASSRRAYARSRKSDSDTSIIDFLTHHPGSTNGDLARGLNLDPDEVAICLTHLTGTGEIRKESHGYRALSPD